MTDRDAIAADWLLRLKEPTVSEQTVADWVAWCAADPANRAAFEAMDELWSLAGGLEAQDELGQPAAAVVRPPSSLWRQRRGPILGIAAAMAASVLVAVAVQAPHGGEPGAVPAERLETERGKVQKAVLADGSEVELGGRTALSVRYSRQTRLIIADAGEAFYRVRKDRERPFVVQAGPVTVTAVGTAFSVEREDNSVAVLVTEGVVEVRAAPRLGSAGGPAMAVRVAAGQRVRFDRGELVQSAAAPDPQAALSWRSGRLDFKDEPLRLVVARINRYSDRQLSISDPSIEDLRVTGTVYGDRVDAWLEGVEAVLPVKVVRIDRGRVVLTPSLASGASGG